MVRGVIFDLDGTLIDSMKIWNQIDIAFLRENGVENPPEDISDIVRKMTVDESSEYFITRFGLSCTKEYVIKRIEELVKIQYEEKIPIKPHVTELLDYLDSRGIPYGVATATYKTLADAVLRRLGILKRMSFLLTDEEFPMGKTSPDIFLRGAELMKLSPEEVLVIEDSLHCIETAAKAGFVTMGVYDEVSEPLRNDIENTADYYVETLGDAAKIIQ